MEQEKQTLTPDQIAEMMEGESANESLSSGNISGNLPNDSQINQLSSLVKDCESKQGKKAQLEAEIKNLNTEILRLTDDLIPTKMQELGVSKLTLENGKKLEVKPLIFASIAEDRKDAALDWLNANGFKNVLKKELIFFMDSARDIDVHAALIHLEKEFEGILSGAMKMGVHASTLKALVNEQVKAGNPQFNEDSVRKLLGIYEVKRAVIK